MTVMMDSHETEPLVMFYVEHSCVILAYVLAQFAQWSVIYFFHSSLLAARQRR